MRIFLKTKDELAITKSGFSSDQKFPERFDRKIERDCIPQNFKSNPLLILGLRSHLTLRLNRAGKLAITRKSSLGEAIGVLDAKYKVLYVFYYASFNFYTFKIFLTLFFDLIDLISTLST